VIPWHPNLCAYVPEHQVCSTFIGSVSRRNNQDKIVGVFIWEKIPLKNSLSQMGGDMWRGHVQVEYQTVEDKVLKWRPV
jgi:hypothetical protein